MSGCLVCLTLFKSWTRRRMLLSFLVCVFPDDSVHRGVKTFSYSQFLLPGSNTEAETHCGKLLDAP